MVHTFAQGQKQSSQTKAASSEPQRRGLFPHEHALRSTLLLQRTIGNQAVQRLLCANAEHEAPLRPSAPNKSHPTLKVGTPGDVYEREADRVADQVIRQQGSRDPVQARPVRESDAGQMAAPPIAQEAISASGLPLDSTTREWMGARFGHDFSRGRVHTEARAAASARALGARAYTVGTALVFDSGQYASDTAEGRRLLAHEFAHLVQQGSSGIDRIQRQPRGDQPASASKRTPPGPGEYTPKEYDAWVKAQPKHEVQIVGPWEPDTMYARYTSQWFWDRGFVYSGRGGNFPWYWFEVWINRADGREYRVWRTADTRAKSAPTTKPPSAAPEKEPYTGPVVEGTEDWPAWIDPDANKEGVFGPIIAARQNVDAAFGTGETVLYEDGTVELFLEGTTTSYVFRPTPGGGYVVYGPDGRRLEMIWVLPEEDIPDPLTDGVE
jgi:Domain of unknown function (DUF4157)